MEEKEGDDQLYQHLPTPLATFRQTWTLGVVVFNQSRHEYVHHTNSFASIFKRLPETQSIFSLQGDF